MVGDWGGALDLGAGKLRLGLSVTVAADGTLTAIIDSIDQGAKVSVETVTFQLPELRLSLPAIGASYAGTLNADGGSTVTDFAADAETGSPIEYGAIEEAMAPDVLDMIGRWIEARSRDQGVEEGGE